MAFEIKNPPEFTTDVTQWNKKTLADGVEMAKEIEKLLNNDVYLKEQHEKLSIPRNVTLPASGWSSSYPYEQPVSMPGITAHDRVRVIGAVHQNGNSEAQDKAIDQAAWAADVQRKWCEGRRPDIPGKKETGSGFHSGSNRSRRLRIWERSL